VKLIILIDALGWDILSGRPFLDDLLPHRRGVRSVYGFSAGAIPSILTGKYPQEHRMWGLFRHSPQTSPFRWTHGFAPFSDSSFLGRAWRHAVEVISRRRARYTGYFETYLVPIKLLPLFDICESRNIYAPDGVPAAETIFDWLRARDIPWQVYTYHEGNDQQVIAEAHRDVDAGRVRALFLYLSQFDAFLHAHRHEEEAITAKLAEYERATRELFEHAARKDPSSEIIICSDHGMTAVHHSVDLMSRIGALGLKVPGELLPMYDSTMARFWFRTPQARARVVGVLEQVDCGHILSDDELRRYGILFEDHCYGELVFALNGGWVIAPSYMGRLAPQGMHGYLPEEPGMTASLLTSYPVERELRDITGFRSVMEALIERE